MHSFGPEKTKGAVGKCLFLLQEFLVYASFQNEDHIFLPLSSELGQSGTEVLFVDAIKHEQLYLMLDSLSYV